MNTRTILLVGLVSSLGVAARAVDVSVSADIHLGKVPPPPPPEIVVVEAGPPGPPPWAPAHGVRHHRSYYYYPGYDVYYRTDDRVWFFLDGGTWRSSVSLPANIRVDFRQAVPLTMETDRPYHYHEKVRTYYPANYFTTQVRMKDAPVKPDMDERNEGGNPDHGHKGKGKAKGKDR
jgi:hypothetical protein